MDLAADLANPLLLLCLLAGGLRRRPSRWFWVRAAAGVGIVYLVTGLDHHFGWWASRGLDFSTHMAVAVSLSVSLAVLDRRWLALALPFLAGYAVLMAHLGYHGYGDSATSALVAAAATLACHLTRRG